MGCSTNVENQKYFYLENRICSLLIHPDFYSKFIYYDYIFVHIYRGREKEEKSYKYIDLLYIHSCV